MKKILFVLVLLACFTATEAMACSICKNPYHKPGNTVIATASASAIVNNRVTTVTSQWLNASQTVTGTQTQSLKDSGNASLSNDQRGMGSPSINFEAVPDFPAPYLTVPAVPLTYQGPYKDSIFENDQIWFNRLKWTKDMIDNLPTGGKVVAAIYEKTKPVSFIQPREGKDFDKSKFVGSLYYLGNVYCKSAGPDDNPGTVWGGCARVLMERGCTFAYKIAGAITYGAVSKATNQSGGASFAGIIGQIFGFNAGAGASNTDHTASGFDIVNLTWACVGVLPQ